MLFHHDSSAAPQTVQTASPVCGTKNFVSVRLYSAPQLHRTIVAILGICARNRPFSRWKSATFKLTHYPAATSGHRRFLLWTKNRREYQTPFVPLARLP